MRLVPGWRTAGRAPTTSASSPPRGRPARNKPSLRRERAVNRFPPAGMLLEDADAQDRIDPRAPVTRAFITQREHE